MLREERAQRRGTLLKRRRDVRGNEMLGLPRAKVDRIIDVLQ